MSTNAKRFLWLCLVLSVSISGVVVLARNSIVRSRPTYIEVGKSSRTAQTIQLRNAQSLTERLETELITITPRGFEPKEITRPAGSFILSVENRSGLQTVTLRFNLTQVLAGTNNPVIVSPSLFEITAPREQPDWNGAETLAPGRYLLSELNHPNWHCYLTINPK